MFKVASVRVHTATQSTQTFFPLIDSDDDSGLQQQHTAMTRPRSNQTRVRYTNNYVSKLIEEAGLSFIT